MPGRIINGTLSVNTFTNTGVGQWSFTNAAYQNANDATGNGAFDLATGFILYVPAVDPNTFLPLPGISHRYRITVLTVVNSSTISGTMLWDETISPEIDKPQSGSVAIISERGTGLGLGFPVDTSVYNNLGVGMTSAALITDARDIVDKITSGGGSVTAEKEQTFAALTTAADGDFAFTGGIGTTPKGAVFVAVNGVEVTVGDGTSSGVDCYWTLPSNSVPKTTATVVAGDRLRWVGSVAGYQLSGTDTIQLTYDI